MFSTFSSKTSLFKHIAESSEIGICLVHIRLWSYFRIETNKWSVLLLYTTATKPSTIVPM